MKQVSGWWLPKHDLHLPEWFRANARDTVDGRVRYQGKKQDAAMRWSTKPGIAIDCGAHVGLHSFYLAQRFPLVLAFEPVADHRECFMANVPGTQSVDPETGSAELTEWVDVLIGRANPEVRVLLLPFALGDRDTLIGMYTKPGSSGDSYVSGDGDIPMRRLDDYALADVAYWKLDCEGGEEAALRGGEQTILRCRPTIMVEQKPRVLGERGIKGAPALDYLLSLGMKVRQEISGDFILNWGEP